MAENKVTFEVEVIGVEEAQDNLKDAEKGAKAVGDQANKSKKGVQNLGEGFNQLGQTVENTSKKSVKGIQAVTGGLGSANETAVTVGRAMVTLADNGSRGMIAILGPIGAVIATLYGLYELYNEITGASLEYEKTAAVSSAVASDLTSKLDELADKGVELSGIELSNMVTSIIDARSGIEYMNEQLAESQQFFSEKIQAQRQLNILLGQEKDLTDENMWALTRFSKNVFNVIVDGLTDWRSQQEKINDARKEMDEINEREKKYVNELSEAYKTRYEASIKEQQAQIKRTTTHIEAMELLETEMNRVNEIQFLAIENSDLSDHDKMIEKTKIEIRTQQDLKEWMGKTKDEIYDQAVERKKNSEVAMAGIKIGLEEIALNKKLAESIKKLNDEKTTHLSQVNALNIQLQKDGYDEQIALAVNTYQTALELNKGDKEKTLIAQKQFQLQMQNIGKSMSKDRENEAKARIDKYKQNINEQSQLNALAIQLQYDGFEEQTLLATNTYETALKLNKGNKKQLLIAEKQYQIAIKDIGSQRLEEQQRIDQQSIDKMNEYIKSMAERFTEYVNMQTGYIDKIAILDIQANQDIYTQQLALLDKNQEIELRSVQDNELAKLEIKKRYSLEKTKVESHATSQMKEFATAQTQAFSSSIAGVIMGTQALGEAVKSTLAGLAQEAIARSLFETASGFASLAIGGPVGGVSAAQHFQAAGMFAAVGATAGIASKAISAGGNKTPAPVNTSPTGQSQTMTQQRPEAKESTPIVYNINFGGSVIYDTREAALRAFSNEITQIQNRPSRGSQSSRIMNARG